MDERSKIRSYRDLEVWKKAMDLVEHCYRATAGFPSVERYGLASQLQRAAVSIPANIAEGHDRQHRAEFLQHLAIAHGSLAELETHIQIAARLEYLIHEKLEELMERCSEVGRMLNGLRRSLRDKKE